MESVISVGSAKLANKSLEWLAGDFIFQLLGSINPFVSSDKYTQMSCAVVRFVVNDGVATADKGIAMRTDKVDVIGSGTINLKNEQLDLGIKPRARGGVGVSLSKPSGWSCQSEGDTRQTFHGAGCSRDHEDGCFYRGRCGQLAGFPPWANCSWIRSWLTAIPAVRLLEKSQARVKPQVQTSKPASQKKPSLEKQLLQNVFGK